MIELMIVVTIIGILAAIAVPAYRDYTIRSRVAECASLYGPIKTDTSLVWSENGTLPGSLNDLPRTSNTSGDFSGDYVSDINLAANGIVTCTLQDIDELGPAGGQTVVFTPATSSQKINWAVGGSVDTKYLPVDGF